MAIDLEISDLPPPETVQGLWQSVPRGREPTSRHAVPASCFSQPDAEARGQDVDRPGAQRQLRDCRRRRCHVTKPSRAWNAASSGT